ncbi:interleukin-17C [Brachyistius frenatus]|uniref:interleukin-17C n=1 Tax=Brachyistius frenatus TaxID=100188 RepID=UPI0037E91C97
MSINSPMETQKQRESSCKQSFRENRRRMDMKQILFFALLLVPAWTCKMFRCYNDTELTGAAERKLRSHYPQPAEPSPTAARHVTLSCPVAQLSSASTAVRDRSLSPWTYVQQPVPDHFPSSYTKAVCLCAGCIQIGEDGVVESHDYNSAEVVQDRVFLKRELCSDGGSYSLRPVSIKVVVGCTCVRASSAS